MAAEFPAVARDAPRVAKGSFPGWKFTASRYVSEEIEWKLIWSAARMKEFSLFCCVFCRRRWGFCIALRVFLRCVCYYDYERLVPAIFSLQCFRLRDTKRYVCAKEKFQFSFSCRTLFRRAALLHKSIFFFYFMKIDINQPHSFRFTATSLYENSIYNLLKSCYEKLKKKI